MQTLPSGRGSGLVLAPFRAVRYDLSRVSDLANVTSPPYDVIGPGTLEELLAASPYNVVRLDLADGFSDRGLGANANCDEGTSGLPASLIRQHQRRCRTLEPTIIR